MGRKRAEDPRSVVIGVRVTGGLAARVDELRGELSRSAWAEHVIGLAAWGEPRVLSAVPRVTDRPALPGAGVIEAPVRMRCVHPGKRSVGGFCKECDHLILPGGDWA